MKLLITGSSGFIGSHLLRMVQDSKWEVAILSSNEIRSSRSLPVFDAIIHLAAYTPKSASDSNLELCESNLAFTQSLVLKLEAPPKKFVFASSLDVYTPVQSQKISEDSPTEPQGFYGQYKLKCEVLLSKWAKENDVTLQILRIGHIYGPGEENYKKLIPVQIKNILSGRTPVITTHGRELRSFLYIEDCCEMILRSLELDYSAGSINLVSGRAVSVLEITRLLLQLSGCKLDLLVQGQDLPTRDCIFDTTKMNELLGVERTSLEHGLKQEIEYFRAKQ